GGQRAAGEEELDGGGDAALGVPAHTEDEDEVERDDRVVDPLRVESEVDHEGSPCDEEACRDVEEEVARGRGTAPPWRRRGTLPPGCRVFPSPDGRRG